MKNIHKTPTGQPLWQTTEQVLTAPPLTPRPKQLEYAQHICGALMAEDPVPGTDAPIFLIEAKINHERAFFEIIGTEKMRLSRTAYHDIGVTEF